MGCLQVIYRKSQAEQDIASIERKQLLLLCFQELKLIAITHQRCVQIVLIELLYITLKYLFVKEQQRYIVLQQMEQGGAAQINIFVMKLHSILVLTILAIKHGHNRLGNA